MNYLEHFVESIKFIDEVDDILNKEPIDYSDIKGDLEYYWNNRNHKLYAQVLDQLQLMGQGLLAIVGDDNLINRCHSMSHNILLEYHRKGLPEQCGLNITIGNVYFNDVNVYDTSREKIKHILEEGFQSDKTLDVHVWLTVENMAVFDLTIMRTLVHRGMLPHSSFIDQPFNIWREDLPSSFRYEPLLVDNTFFLRVDREG